MRKEYGTLDIIIGCMFSGKSRELIRRCSIFVELGFRVLYINSHLDTRSEKDFSTHDPTIDLSECVNTVQVKRLEDLKDSSVAKYDVIAIDEAQFFKNLMPCVKWVEKYNAHVIVAGLDSNFNREKFGKVLDLIPLADNVTKLHAYCIPCSRKSKREIREAIHTLRLPVDEDEDDGLAEDEEKIDVGGKDKYVPVCRECYLHNN